MVHLHELGCLDGWPGRGSITGQARAAAPGTEDDIWQQWEHEVCDLKHQQIGQELADHSRILTDHTGRIYALERVAGSMTDTLERLEKLACRTEERVAEQEAQPGRRWNKTMDIVRNWATLIILGLLAAKIGLS